MRSLSPAETWAAIPAFLFVLSIVALGMNLIVGALLGWARNLWEVSSDDMEN